MNDEIATRIGDLLRRRKNPDCLKIGIGGGSGSGKSAVAELIRTGLDPVAVDILRLDRFFKSVDEMPTYYSEYHRDSQPDFNRPDSLKSEEMVAFCKEAAEPEVLILDGHFSLYYPEMRELMDVRCFVTIDLDAMLHRRTERNLANNYGGDRENILNYNRECVAPSYERFILPSSQHADLLIPNNETETAERDDLIETLCRNILETRRR